MNTTNTTNSKAVLLKPLRIPWMKTVNWKNDTFEQVRVSGITGEPEPNIFATNKYLLDCCSYTRGEMSSRIGDIINSHVFELEINADGSLNTCDFIQLDSDTNSVHVSGLTTHTSQDTFVHDGNGKYMKNNIIANILRNEIKYRNNDVSLVSESSYDVVMRDGDPVLSELLVKKYNTIIDGNITRDTQNSDLRNILYNMVDYTSSSMGILGTLYDEIFMDAISGCNEMNECVYITIPTNFWFCFNCNCCYDSISFYRISIFIFSFDFIKYHQCLESFHVKSKSCFELCLHTFLFFLCFRRNGCFLIYFLITHQI